MPGWVRPVAVSILVLLPESAAADLPARLLTRSRAPIVEVDATGRVPLMVEVSGTSDAKARGLWPVAPGLAAVRVAPGALEAFLDAHADLDFVVAPRLSLHLDRAVEWTHVASASRRSGLTGEGVVVGILDAGFDLAHPSLRDAEGGTRVAWLMTPTLPAGFHPDLEAEYGCTMPDQAACAIYSKEDIDALLASTRPLPLELGDITGHGTHVASIAAGNGGASLPSPTVYEGVAPNATLVLGVISSQLYGDEVIRLTRFVYDRADELAAPAVVNLSAGTHQGPHDGSDALSSGLAALTDAPGGGRAFVVSAGNDGSTDAWGGQSVGIHQEREVRSAACVPIQTLAPAGGVEVWIALRSSSGLRVGLRGPRGEPWLAPAAPGESSDYDSDRVAASITHHPPTAGKPDLSHAVVTWSGSWPDGAAMEFEFVGDGYAHLWVHDIVFGAIARFAAPSVRTTIAIPATHPSLIAVGSSINRMAWPSLEGLITPWDQAEDDISVWSGGGPSLVGFKPDLIAPGEYVVAAMSSMADPREPLGASIFKSTSCSPTDAACTVVDERFAAARGTSMAAPVVAGAAALLFEVAPELTQADMRRLLTTSARRGGAGSDPQRGFGWLDFESALAQLAEPNAPPTEVVAARSWWTLSTDALPPTASAPIIGIIQLRDADGRPALGDPAGVQIVLEGAELVEPPTALAHQTLSFAMRRSAADVAVATIEVRYGDVRIGEVRSLPAATIGLACPEPTLTVAGGCGCSLPARPLDSWLGWVGVVGSIALLRQRRRPRT